MCIYIRVERGENVDRVSPEELSWKTNAPLKKIYYIPANKIIQNLTCLPFYAIDLKVSNDTSNY